MFLVTIAIALLPFVVCETDPTKVCLPDTIQFNVLNLATEEIGVWAIDFNKQLYGQIFPNQSFVHDLKAAKAYNTDASGNCRSSILPPEGVHPQCFRSVSKRMGEGYIGLGPNRIPFEAWEFPYSRGVAKLTYTNQPDEPRGPAVVKFIDEKGVITYTFFFNPSLNITSPTIFNIPDPCPPETAL
ncbi:unnamed protein product [Lymnaea stagnalis]|uniref:Uncharacterized protein n=1 Tax=Lymnaea stagnalis TaxID=6523 RepID=A0AAV2IG74_LYMST